MRARVETKYALGWNKSFMASDIFINSCFEYNWINWSNMDWNFSEGSGNILMNIFIFSGDILINIVIVGLYISLKLIEYHILLEFWALYCSEIDRKSEACWILLWLGDNPLVRKYNTLWECWTYDNISLQIKEPLYLYTLRCYWCRIVTPLVVDYSRESFYHNHLSCLRDLDE